VSVVSWSGPDNLNEGEILTTPTTNGCLLQWQLTSHVPGIPRKGKQYRFTAVLDVPNPGCEPLGFRPEVNIDGALEDQFAFGVSNADAVIEDPALDGDAPGHDGLVRFSVAENQGTWALLRDQAAGVTYAGTPTSSSTERVQIRIKPGSQAARHRYRSTPPPRDASPWRSCPPDPSTPRPSTPPP
jgi:hypothetical protein